MGEQAEEFMRDYHGHQFIDGHGETFRAVACMAPYQKTPKVKPQKDARDGTIADDPVFKEFVESLAQQGAVRYEAPPDPKADIRPDESGETPLLLYMKTRAKERRARLEKREKKKWRPEADYIAEEPKKPKWRCKECGTSKNLEEDPDDRGVFYCVGCWEYWESAEVPVSKPKKKKKK